MEPEQQGIRPRRLAGLGAKTAQEAAMGEDLLERVTTLRAGRPPQRARAAAAQGREAGGGRVADRSCGAALAGRG
eukprot:14276235-Alexandrium_andersonii.AAC.1